MKRKLGCQVTGKTVEQKIENLRIMKDIGFDVFFTSVNVDDPAPTEKLLNAAANIGIELETIHALFTNINRMWYDDQSGEGTFKMLMDSLNFCADHDVPTMVMHESGNRIGPDVSMAGLGRFREIVQTANEKGVKIAIENLRRTNHIAFLFHNMRDLDVYYCWDCGHELCYTPGVNHVALFPEKLACTHIHDNRGIYMYDDHLLPFDGNTDWQKKADLIKASGYQGPLTMEIVRVGYDGRYADWTEEEYYKEAYKRISKFAKMCE